jgi:putative spermidine/putrescine transport system ATP-binding protein
MPDLILERVTKRFGDVTAVNDLSFSVEHGEFIALLGPSGCGKTTTLRMIAGFEQPDGGQILIDGHNVTRTPPQKRDIGIVFQNYALFPHMTVTENVRFGLKMRGVPRAQADDVVASTLALVRLEGFQQRYPAQLSGGQQQRVALARAIAIHPRLLLLDEPLSNLDAKLRDEMRDEIRRIQRKVGITAIFVTHDQGEAFALADRVAVMDGGQLHQLADPVSIYESPANAIVGSFVGQANVLAGTMMGGEGGRTVVELSNGTRIVGIGQPIPVGAACKVFIKHERLVIGRGAAPLADNHLSCQVTGRTFLGDANSYALAADSLMLKAVVPNRAEFEQFNPGDRLVASWQASDCRIFPA